MKKISGYPLDFCQNIWQILGTNFYFDCFNPKESSVERFSGRVSSQKSKLSLSLYNFESQVLNFHLSADVTQEK